jgi:hypothetical protein
MKPVVYDTGVLVAAEPNAREVWAGHRVRLRQGSSRSCPPRSPHMPAAPRRKTSFGLLPLAGWPERMRVIVRKERPHPGARLRFTDIDGHRFTLRPCAMRCSGTQLDFMGHDPKPASR